MEILHLARRAQTKNLQAAGQFVVPEIEIEGPSQTKHREFQQDEPRPTGEQKTREVIVLGPVEKCARPSEENERRCTEMCDSACKEDAGRRSTGGNTGIDARMIDCHHDHDRSVD